ncbi:MAG: dihydropteroate synthase [Bacteroidota bacterium]
MLNPPSTLNCKGQLLDIRRPCVMGILNVTPDSFFDGGRYLQAHTILQQIEKMKRAGASIIDIGGMSSRPGASLISEAEELSRVLPVIEQIQQHFPDTILSVDTFRAKVAKESVAAGASMINDISAGRLDEELLATIAQLDVPYILMHMQGQPQTMQDQPQYENVVVEVLDFFIEKVGKLKTLGLEDIILDVGFGFGKSIDHNYELLKNLGGFRILDLPIMAGLSRKSMIFKVLQTTAEKALNGTTALHMVALQNGAKILRAHDVEEAMQTIQLWETLERQPLI